MGKRLSGACRFLLAIDDLANRPHHCGRYWIKIWVVKLKTMLTWRPLVHE